MTDEYNFKSRNAILAVIKKLIEAWLRGGRDIYVQIDDRVSNFREIKDIRLTHGMNPDGDIIGVTIDVSKETE